MPRGKKDTTTPPPVVAFQPVDSFDAKRRQRGSSNPYVEVLSGISEEDWGAWYELPGDIDEETRNRVVSLIRAAASYLELAVSVRYRDNDQFVDANDEPMPDIAGWKITGPVRKRGPRKPKEDAPAK